MTMRPSLYIKLYHLSGDVGAGTLIRNDKRLDQEARQSQRSWCVSSYDCGFAASAAIIVAASILQRRRGRR